MKSPSSNEGSKGQTNAVECSLGRKTACRPLSQDEHGWMTWLDPSYFGHLGFSLQEYLKKKLHGLGTIKPQSKYKIKKLVKGITQGIPSLSGGKGIVSKGGVDGSPMCRENSALFLDAAKRGNNLNFDKRSTLRNRPALSLEREQTNKKE